MTPEEIRRIVHRALSAMSCTCYDVATREYGPDYPCEKCETAELAAALEREAAA